MLRVVADPGVLIAALLSPGGTPANLVRRWREADFDLVISPLLLAELERVLTRPKFHSRITADELKDFLALLSEHSVSAADPEVVEPGLTPDPKDDYLVALARAANADVLVSGDRHLTGLHDSRPPVLTPRELLARLEA